MSLVESQIFQHWKNCLEQDPVKIPETKKVIEKIEYKGHQKIKKEIEVRELLIKRKVTKGFLERQQIKPFGIGKTEDDLRQNVNLTSVQRGKIVIVLQRHLMYRKRVASIL